MEHRKVMEGRDRMCAVLEKYVPRSVAIERANNIALGLTVVGEDSGSVIVQGLKHAGVRGEDFDKIAADMLAAWKATHENVRRSARPYERVESGECHVCGAVHTRRDRPLRISVQTETAEYARTICGACATLITKAYQIARD